jgi:hypothetical protein
MKKSFLVLAVLLISVITVKGQIPPFWSCMINFEDNPCWEATYTNLTIPAPNNIWNICTPHKTVFDSAYSSPHAILTDSAGTYPVNDTSSFIIKFSPYSYCECAPIIGGYYKFDSDSLNDYGRIEFSLDHGTTWRNALTDTLVYWYTEKPVLTGRIPQWKEFYGMFWMGDPRPDTIYYRFTFISDGIETNQQGWMLDNLMLIVHTEGIQDKSLLDEITVYPNPASNVITVSGKTFTGDRDVAVYDILGQLRLHQSVNTIQKDIDISGLSKGIYMVKVLSGNSYTTKMLIKQ